MFLASQTDSQATGSTVPGGQVSLRRPLNPQSRLFEPAQRKLLVTGKSIQQLESRDIQSPKPDDVSSESEEFSRRDPIADSMTLRKLFDSGLIDLDSTRRLIAILAPCCPNDIEILKQNFFRITGGLLGQEAASLLKHTAPETKIPLMGMVLGPVAFDSWLINEVDIAKLSELICSLV